MQISTVTLLMVNAMLAMASPMVTPVAELEKRKIETKYETKCVTHYEYPDGSPADGHRHHKAKPTKEPQVFYHHEHDDDDKPARKPKGSKAPKEPEYTKPQSNSDDRGAQPYAKTDAAPQSYGGGNYQNPGEDFTSNCLYHHNIHRANHSAPDVTWSDALADAAQQLANSCNYGHNTDLGRYSGGYGQNIAMYAATDNLGSEVQFIRTSITQYWYNQEIDLYGNAYGHEPSMGAFHDWGHFSQIVWKGTKEVGCAVAYCKSGLASYPGYYSVCNYGPPGNYQGEYSENVGAPQGMATADA